jgi:Holliday junction resolvasome RuvABC DNA-binding subunit
MLLTLLPMLDCLLSPLRLRSWPPPLLRKTLIRLVSVADHGGLINAIEGEDVTYLTKFPGVGKKTAQQLLGPIPETLINFKNNCFSSKLPKPNKSCASSRTTWLSDFSR